jgi:xanthine/uracil permease
MGIPPALGGQAVVRRLNIWIGLVPCPFNTIYKLLSRRKMLHPHVCSLYMFILPCFVGLLVIITSILTQKPRLRNRIKISVPVGWSLLLFAGKVMIKHMGNWDIPSLSMFFVFNAYLFYPMTILLIFNPTHPIVLSFHAEIRKLIRYLLEEPQFLRNSWNKNAGTW